MNKFCLQLRGEDEGCDICWYVQHPTKNDKSLRDDYGKVIYRVREKYPATWNVGDIRDGLRGRGWKFYDFPTVEVEF